MRPVIRPIIALRRRPRRGSTSPRRCAARAFTLLEALVATVLLISVMAAVSQVFTLSSLASGRTVAHATVLEAAATFEQAVRRRIATLQPDGLLILDCPQVLGLRGETGYADALLGFRHDRLVFVASRPNGFESVTDRNLPSANNAANNTGAGRAYVGSDAVVFFGPGFPDGRIIAPQIGAGPVDAAVPAKDWMLCQRLVLLGVPAGAFTSFTGEQPPAVYPLGQLANSPAQGLYACGIDAVQQTSGGPNGLIDDTLTFWPDARGLWDLNLAPVQVNAVLPSAPDDNYAYYGRAGFNHLPHIADLRIEWTDGSMADPRDVNPPDGQPDDPSMQWFGPPRDTAEPPGWTGPAVAPRGDVCPKWQWLAEFGGSAGEMAAFLTTQPDTSNYVRIETVGDSNTAAGPQASYRMMWSGPGGTWGLRPRALRFSFRVYDEHDRISNMENVDTDVPADGSPDVTLKRYGLEFSFVVAVP